MDVNIRSVRIEDAPLIFEIKGMDGVRENTRALVSGRIDKTESFIKGLTERDHVLVAEIEENGIKKVVGMVSLCVEKNPRASHCGSIGVFVHTNYQSKGIGKKLFEKVIDLADNWLMLVRLELDVWVGNEKAINLYKSFGFVIEGTKKYNTIRYGEYSDVYLMARYNTKLIPSKD